MSDVEEEQGGNVFDALDAVDEDQHHATARKSVVQVYRVPVTLHKDEATGEPYFYLQKGSFPNHSITDLKIVYTQEEKDQVREQVLADNRCPEVLLKNVQVVCGLRGKVPGDDDSEFLSDESFRLSGSKIGAVRMRMYAQQKLEAQKQLEDPNCDKVVLRLDIECRLANREMEKQ
jgi:hypothetical protein